MPEIDFHIKAKSGFLQQLEDPIVSELEKQEA